MTYGPLCGFSIVRNYDAMDPLIYGLAVADYIKEAIDRNAVGGGFETVTGPEGIVGRFLDGLFADLGR